MNRNLDLPQMLLSNYKFVKEFSEGGSTGRVFLVQKKDFFIILKFASMEGIGFNGKPWNKQQFLKLKNIQECLPKESTKLFPKVFEFHETDEYNYYTMEFFKGISVPRYFSRKPQMIIPFIYNLLERLNNDLYSIGNRLGYSDYITKNHFDRITHRIGLLNKREGPVYNSYIKNREMSIGGVRYDDLTFFSDELFKFESININGFEYINMPKIIDLLQSNLSEIDKSLSPQYVPSYVHGDLLLRNVLLNRSGEIRLIDVRGDNVNEKIPSVISLEYEMGKIYHSFLQELIRNNLISIEIQRCNNRVKFFVRFKKNNLVSAFLNIRNILPSLIKERFRDTVFWGNRNSFLNHVLLSEAAHFAADAVNRLAQDPSGCHTLTYYIVSVVLFNDLLSRFNMIRDKPVRPYELLFKGDSILY